MNMFKACIFCLFVITLIFAVGCPQTNQLGENSDSLNDVTGVGDTPPNVNNQDRREGKRELHPPENHLDEDDTRVQSDGQTPPPSSSEAVSTADAQALISQLAAAHSPPRFSGMRTTSIASFAAAVDLAVQAAQMHIAMSVLGDINEEYHQYC